MYMPNLANEIWMFDCRLRIIFWHIFQRSFLNTFYTKLFISCPHIDNASLPTVQTNAQFTSVRNMFKQSV